MQSGLSFFFFNDTATTEIYTLSLHDALPIWRGRRLGDPRPRGPAPSVQTAAAWPPAAICPGLAWDFTTTRTRSEEHTSELQSRQYLVCRLLLEKKKKKKKIFMLSNFIYYMN